MKRYRVAVCKGSDCRRGGSNAVFEEAKAAVAREGLSDRCTVSRGGCYGLCHLGPNVVVREADSRPLDTFSRDSYQLTRAPGETHYGAMSPERMAKVATEHLKEDRPVEEWIERSAMVPPPSENGDDGSS